MECKKCPFDPEFQITPFSNAAEAMMWKERNCEKCINYESESETEEKAKCKLAFNIDLGFITGNIPLQTARDIGCNYNPLYSYARLSDKCRKFNDKNYPTPF